METKLGELWSQPGALSKDVQACGPGGQLTGAGTDLGCNLTRSTLKETSADFLSSRTLCRIAQRASKQMTGYFGGYISKRQKMGKFELKKSAAALPSLKEKLLQRNTISASAQLAHTINRMFVTLEGKGILQTCTQEFMLASQYKAHDALSGECIRTFRHREFHGKYYLDRYDAMIQRATPM